MGLDLKIRKETSLKLFAFYLPQFHETEENNEWWGKGFTEWTHVKSARPLYKGHMQPKKPLGDNYYNLLDKDVVQWQTDLMRQYGVDGLIYYHYYFQGKKLLEKPAENLLEDSGGRQFFFCWANHSWFRAVGGKKDLLIEQTYGGEEDWEKHIQYLLPFFKDERYEKKGNRPLFMLYCADFEEKHRMMDYFNSRCVDAGFDGIYVIETASICTSEEYDTFKANASRHTRKIFIRQPNAVKRMWWGDRHSMPGIYKRIMNKLIQRGILEKVIQYSGNKLYDMLMKGDDYPKDEVIHGLFFEWDNTPRHAYRGHVIHPADKEHIFRYLNQHKSEEYIFINAWNEWAEGMMLEPTEENGFRYLEWIKEWKESSGQDGK